MQTCRQIMKGLCKWAPSLSLSCTYMTSFCLQAILWDSWEQHCTIKKMQEWGCLCSLCMVWNYIWAPGFCLLGLRKIFHLARAVVGSDCSGLVTICSACLIISFSFKKSHSITLVRKNKSTVRLFVAVRLQRDFQLAICWGCWVGIVWP